MISKSTKINIATNVSLLGLSVGTGVTTSLLLHFDVINNFLKVNLQSLNKLLGLALNNTVLLKMLYGVIAGLSIFLIGKIVEFGVRALTANRFDNKKLKEKGEVIELKFEGKKMYDSYQVVANGNEVLFYKGEEIETRKVDVSAYIKGKFKFIGTSLKDNRKNHYLDRESNIKWMVDQDGNFAPEQTTVLLLDDFRVVGKALIPTSRILLQAAKQTASFGLAGNK